jgi:hypothetical protein
MDKLTQAFREGFQKEAQGYVAKALGLSADQLQNMGRPVRRAFKGTQEINQEANDVVKGFIPDSAYNSNQPIHIQGEQMDQYIKESPFFEAENTLEAIKNQAAKMRQTEDVNMGNTMVDAGAGGVGLLGLGGMGLVARNQMANNESAQA